jgi:inosine-uridine nucleoside N-ribohydrolase
MKACLLASLLLLLGTSAFARSRDVILTTDCGADIDDQFAIAYLLLVPQVHVRGIVTTHAPDLPQNAQSSAACARDVMHRMGLSHTPPVFAGSDVALKVRAPLPNAGVEFIVRTARSYSRANRLLILTIGATTDVASAFLADPSIEDRVEILTMGFQSWPQGTDPWNIQNDPLAYRVLLDSRAPITIGAADVCAKHLALDQKEADRLLEGHGQFAGWLDGLVRNWLTKNAALAARVVSPGHWVIWDTIVVAHILGFTTVATYSRPALNLSDCTFTFAKTTKTIRWITSVDQRRMWPDFVRRLDTLRAHR